MSSTTATPIAHVWRPSSARRIASDGFTPVPRGAAPGAPVPPSWPVKDPADVLDYQFDVSAALAGNESDVIGAASVQVTPAGPGDLAADRVAVDGALVVIWFSGGQSGTIYTVHINVETVGGRMLSRSAFLPVLSLIDGAPPATSLTTEQGLVVTDENGSPILLGS